MIRVIEWGVSMTRRVECRVIESRILRPVFDQFKPFIENKLWDGSDRRKVVRAAAGKPTHFCRAMRRPIGPGLMIDLRG
jgi:hypothetical protein